MKTMKPFDYFNLGMAAMAAFVVLTLSLTGCKALEVTADICDLITFDDKPAPRSGTVTMDDGETFGIEEVQE